ncbi:hypothetical protein L1987_17305 [Smallanthus sonchifolius]|uniref:Uncharacterized protein n=1 Tax=Smallanthus sonchifolius TaxID=185202 RepID=A0ACB9IX44_9ASTR|nr:hypothetical protein L1987_17305 [Smallanthus sonchifolius]
MSPESSHTLPPLTTTVSHPRVFSFQSILKSFICSQFSQTVAICHLHPTIFQILPPFRILPNCRNRHPTFHASPPLQCLRILGHMATRPSPPRIFYSIFIYFGFKLSLLRKN